MSRLPPPRPCPADSPLFAQPGLARADGPRFNGPAYDHDKDQARLTGQIERIRDLMLDGRWRTLPEIEAATGDPQASISAQLRHLRKRRFGSHTVEKRRRGGDGSGLWEYRVLVGGLA